MINGINGKINLQFITLLFISGEEEEECEVVSWSVGPSARPGKELMDAVFYVSWVRCIGLCSSNFRCLLFRRSKLVNMYISKLHFCNVFYFYMSKLCFRGCTCRVQTTKAVKSCCMYFTWDGYAAEAVNCLTCNVCVILRCIK